MRLQIYILSPLAVVMVAVAVVMVSHQQPSSFKGSLCFAACTVDELLLIAIYQIVGKRIDALKKQQVNAL